MKTKYKIYIVAVVWLAVCASMIWYFFGIFDKTNNISLSKIVEQKKELAVLEAEQKSFQMASQDLKQLSEKSYQPDDFFSKDVTLVKEIITLEELGERLKVDFRLTGLSGTIKSSAKAKTQSDIVTVPYGIGLNGPFARVVDFIETLENLNFITHLTSLAITHSSDGTVNANLAALFYLKK